LEGALHYSGGGGGRPTVREPPFTVKSMVEYCWGMTFSLSHQAQQNDLGKMFNEQFKDIRKVKSQDADFLTEVILRLATTLRTIAFIRDAHVRVLNSNARDLAEKRKFWADITQLASRWKEAEFRILTPLFRLRS